MIVLQNRHISSIVKVHCRFERTVRLWIRVVVTTNLILLLFHQIVVAKKIDTTTANRNLHHGIDWYTKYEVYPDYCSTPEQMSKRNIPAIDTTQLNQGMIGETRLLHVTAILRHGARTPYKANLNCWADTMYVADEKQWDCNLTTFLSPPPPSRIHQEEGGGSQQQISQRQEFGYKTTTTTTTKNENAMFLFEKKYDSLQLPLGNELNGTCQKGQLLLQGYEQEYTNGKILRNAYVYSSKSKDSSSDARMRLFDSATNGADGKYLWDTLYYRVDDDQRTLMSGQVVLSGLFYPELQTYVQDTKGEYPIIPLHTADRDTDIVEPNSYTCPRLDEILEYIQTDDPEYDRIFDSSKEAELLFNFQKEVLKLPNPDAPMDNIDCLMTTICTDRTLPDPVNDYTGKSITVGTDFIRYLDDNNGTDSIASNGTDLDGIIGDDTLQSDGDTKNDTYDKIYGPNRFQRLVNYETSQYGYYASFNGGEFSKLGIGPLWEEIVQNIKPFLSDTTELKRPLAMVAGHDTTIIPLLVSLGPNVWDKIWPTYASMIILELHAINIDDFSNRTIFQSNYAFRLLNNGVVITPRIDGCELELCDITILMNIVESFMKLYITNCTRHKPPSTASFEDIIDESEAMVSTKDGAILFVALRLLCMICGSVCTCLFMKYALSRAFANTHQHHYQQGGTITSSTYDPDDDEIPFGITGKSLTDSYIDDFPKRTITIT